MRPTMPFTQDLHAIQSAFDQAQHLLAHLRTEWQITLAEAAEADEIDTEQWEDLALATTTALAPQDATVDFLLEATRLAPGIVEIGLDPFWLGKLDLRAKAFLAEGRQGDSNHALLSRMAARVEA
jgi:hypothetical protein